MTKIDAARELLSRRKARRNFWAFCQYMDIGFFTDKKKHLKQFAGKLQKKVYPQSDKKLMGSMPPRAGKSYLISMFCAWLFGKYPDIAIMRNSYGANLAYTFSRHIKAIIQLPAYQVLFPGIKLSKDHTGVEDWALVTAKTTSYFCAGVGGPVTGKGCDVAMLDDPIKNFQDACSATILKTTWEWKQSTHDSRKEKLCPEVIIATRWSKKDPSGQSLKHQKGQWDATVIPAVVDGKSFCSEVKTTEEYRRIKETMDNVIWQAEFMQEPIEIAGLLYAEEELKRFKLSELNKHNCIGKIGYTDTADEGMDYLASAIGEMFGQKVYVSDVLFTQDPIEITEGLVAEQIKRNVPQFHIVESNNGGKSFARNIKEIVSEDVPTVVKWKANTTNKMTRMIMASGRVKNDFYFRDDYEPGSDYDKFMDNLTSISRIGDNDHDDAADCITGLSESIDRLKGAKMRWG